MISSASLSGVRSSSQGPTICAPIGRPSGEVAIGSALFRAVAVRRLSDDAAWDRGTGSETEHFRPVFEAWRRRRLRRDVDVSAWDGMFRLAVTTIGDGRGGNVQVGDRIDAGRPP